ncbi:hypothetical protein D3C83_79380 [compost metagenome]
MNQPSRMMSTLEAPVKKMLHSGFTCRAGSRSCAAVWVKPWSRGSMPEGMKLAAKPPDTPANAQAMPARGCLPAARKITPPSGMTRT